MREKQNVHGFALHVIDPANGDTVWLSRNIAPHSIRDLHVPPLQNLRFSKQAVRLTALEKLELCEFT